jgi:hypothetical protein
MVKDSLYPNIRFQEDSQQIEQRIYTVPLKAFR